MPELPEAETIARTLRSRLRGKTLSYTILNRPDILHGERRPLDSALLDRRVEDVTREGKRVVISVAGGSRLVVALGMSGRLTVERESEPILSHTHLRVGVKRTGLELRFRDPRRFGGLWLLGAPASRAHADDGVTRVGRRLSTLGPDALAIRIGAFRDILSRDRQIKALLLDQRAIAGLGNIYCDEALHRAGIHPLTKSRSLSPPQMVKLLRCIRAVLRAGIKYGGSTFMDYRNADGRPGGFQLKHRVYNREGEACRGCKAIIVRIQAAGRSTHLCPACQVFVSPND